MSSRRHLVSRARMNNEASASPAPSRTAPQQNVELPPYQHPECRMTEAQQQALAQLKADHKYKKYKTTLKAAMSSLTNAAVSSNDRLHESKTNLETVANKRDKGNGVVDDPKEAELEQQRYHQVLEKKVREITKDAENALRELVDFDDEQKMHSTHLTEVIDTLKAAPPLRNHDEMEDDEDDLGIPSATDLLKKTKADYATRYHSKSKVERYGDNEVYSVFKRVLHDAMYHNSGPPLAKPRDWFPEENAKSGSRRDRDANSADSDDVIIERAEDSLKCPLSMQYYEDATLGPCGHHYDRKSFISWFDTAHTHSRQVARGREVKCPETGCNRYLRPEDLIDDPVMMRKVARAKKRDARAAEEDGYEEDDDPRGGQRRRPQQLSDDDDDDQESASSQVKKVKSERMSRGPSSAPNRRRYIPEDEDVEMED
ncbi:hypothetical protein HYALB_00007659 [Hymenoscyphus albidus]|uniref:SP-RING-type domain-containing protein n=1 Tax=Hymenoscyphus albidus TaxID=595503 RepID=A0A9N9LEE4_9HELO|nr:hypothetical protein HYALB_00007659 [Hymenoscyphus albidus]